MVQEIQMPQPRKYRTRAEQQAAYRQRRATSEQELLAQKGLPAMPAIPTMPGHLRWSAMIKQAHTLLFTAAEEMQSYHDDRSEPWQESAKAEALLNKLDHIQESMAPLQEFE
jgi:hypothetical protein